MKKRIKKLTALLLTVFLVSVTTVSAASVQAVSETQTEPIDFQEISTVEDLYMINYDLDGNYKLMNDIDLTEATAEGGDWDFDGRGWEPIGSNGTYSGEKPFTGIFDGNKHEIKGLWININSLPSGTNWNDDNVGLFATNAGTIKNLTVSGKISIAKSTFIIYIGGIVGNNSGTIENCCNKIDFDVKGKYAGGIVGYNSGMISNCCNKNDIANSEFASDDGVYAGGIAGCNTKSITQSYNTGNISLSGYNSHGGIYSSGISYSSQGNVSDCYNSGNITANNTYYIGSYGGYSAGIAYLGNVRNCYNIGSALNAIGITTNHDTVSNCYFLSGTGADAQGAKSLTAAQMKIEKIYSGFDFNNVWFIDKNSEYPYPQLIHNRQIPLPSTPETVMVTKKPDKLNYYVGEEFDSTGIEVTAVYENGESEIISDYQISGFDSTAGIKIITISYKGISDTFEVEVVEKPVIVSSIAILQGPDKTTYHLGEHLDTTGLVIIGICNNGTVKTIENYTTSEISKEIGEQVITVTYNNLTTSFIVNVVEKDEPTTVEPTTEPKPAVTIGDVNGDGNVNGADAGLLSRYTSGWDGYASKIKDMKAADINGDGKVNGADSGILSRYTSGWDGYNKYFSA